MPDPVLVDVSEAKEFICKQEIIRMAHCSSPSGYEEEAATLHNILWLRQVIGFKGRIEFFYGYGKGIYKIIKLLGEEKAFAPGHKLELTGRYANVVLISFREFLTEWRQYPSIELMVATDSAEEIAYRYNSSTEILFKAHYSVLLNYDFAYFAKPSFLEAAQFLSQPAAEYLLTRKLGIADLMLMAAKKEVVTWSLSGFSKACMGVASPVLLIRDLSEIAQELFLEKPQLITGPILLLLHNDLNFSDFSALQGIMPLVTIDDPLFRYYVERKAGDVVLVSLGTLPMVVFEALFQQSLFPALLEDCSIDGVPAKKHPNVSKEIRELIKAVAGICRHREMSPVLKKTVIKYIADSWTPNSELRLFLDKVKQDYAAAVDPYLHKVAKVLLGRTTVIPRSQNFAAKNHGDLWVHGEAEQDLPPVAKMLLGKPAVIPRSRNFSSNNPWALLVHGEVEEISQGMKEKMIDLASPADNRELGFFLLLFNERSGVRGVIMQYLYQNPQACDIISKDKQCLRQMHESSLTGREQAGTVKQVITYCRPSLNYPSLQDNIFTFCGGKLLGLGERQKSVYQLMELFTLNLTLASQFNSSREMLPVAPVAMSTDIPDISLSEGFLWIGITLFVTIASLAIVRRGESIVKFLQTAGERLYGGCRRQLDRGQKHSFKEASLV